MLLSNPTIFYLLWIKLEMRILSTHLTVLCPFPAEFCGKGRFLRFLGQSYISTQVHCTAVYQEWVTESTFLCTLCC